MSGLLNFLTKIFHKKETLVIPTFDESQWQTSSHPDTFFEGLKTEGDNTVKLELAFLQRFSQRVAAQAQQLHKGDERDTFIINQINEVRQYTKVMPIEVRTELAQIKRLLLEKF